MTFATKPPPPGWPRIAVSVHYADATTAIDWLCKAFGFETRVAVKTETGKVAHAELVFGEGLIMMGDEQRRPWAKTPRELDGACTQSVVVVVDDVDAHCRRARAAGATIATEPTTTDYGEGYWVDRTYEAIDVEGHHWWFLQRLETNAK